jgi:hypothetical protein
VLSIAEAPASLYVEPSSAVAGLLPLIVITGSEVSTGTTGVVDEDESSSKVLIIPTAPRAIKTP